MTEGWVKIHRSVMASGPWLKERFDQNRAWIDLILLASHKDSTFLLGVTPMTVKRGQFVYSMLKLASRWHWSEAKVKRFLTALKTMERIEVQTTNHFTKITICNYDRYQSNEKQNDGRTEEQTTDDRRTIDGRSTTFKNDKNENNEKNVKNNTPRAARVWEFPEKWGDKAKQAFQDWTGYRKQAKFKTTDMMLEKLIAKYADDPRTFVAAVNYTIEKGWQGLQEPTAARNGSSAPMSNHERNLATIKASLEGHGTK